MDAEGTIYVADTGNHRIQKLSPDGEPLAQWGTQGTGLGELQRPSGNVYVTELGNHRVQKFSPGMGGAGPSRTAAPSAPAA